MRRPWCLSLTLLALGLAAGAGAALLWPLVLRRLHRRGRIGRDTMVRLRSLRGRLVLWLVVIELVLGQDLPGRLAGGGP